MLDQVVVESGHLVDSPDRAEPRFPPEAESRVKAALADVLARWRVGPGSVVLTQGARGADILVAELARDRGADVRMLLALPPEELVARSVDLPRSTWARRFVELTAAYRPEVLDPGEEPFARNNERVLEEAAALAETHDVPLRAVVVWDGQPEEGAGGTAEFVRAARARGADVVVVEPRAAWRTANVPYWERQRAAGPKRLLALDGGGVRGIITLELLHEMERVLGDGDESFVLADYFDYVAGTSTGAVIATALALGHRVATIQERYRTLANAIFQRRWLPGRFRSKYKDGALTSELQAFFGATATLGSDELRTLLLVVTHRVDSDSIWPLSNNTSARYNDRSRPDCNLDLPLYRVVRGSTAAPVYFLPEAIRVGANEAVFEDGGVTPFNNPAPLLFQMATLPCYRLGWATGADNLLLISVGTGSAPAAHELLRRRDVHLLFQARNVLRVIMNGSSVENDRLCRALGDCRYGAHVDNEFSATDVPDLPGRDPLFSYVRYNADISRRGLDAAGLSRVDAKEVAKLDAVGALDDLRAIGAAARAQVSASHFTGFAR